MHPRVALLAASAMCAGGAPQLAVVSADPFFVVPISRPPSLFTEVPPALLAIPAAGGPGCPAVAAPALAAFLTTAFTGLCVADAPALPVAPGARALGFDAASCSVPFSGESFRGWPPAAVPARSEWFRNYDGVMGAAPLGGALLLVRHGEHKNELCWANGNLYQGLINADVDARSCFSGAHNGTFSDCQPAYNAFVTGASVPFTAAACFGLGALGNASTADLGPLAWPAAGYLNATGGKASYGVRQPSALAAWDGAAVLLYIDNGFSTADVWVARAPPGAPLLAASFAAFDHAARAWRLPTLPASFDARDVMASLRAPSPAGAAGSGGAPAFALAPAAGAVHAAAARLTVGGAPSGLHLVVYDIVNYTQCFGGSSPANLTTRVGERVVRDIAARRRGGTAAAAAAAAGDCVPPWRLMLRVTADFVSFSEPAEIAAFASPGFGAAPLAYPSLLSLDGARTDEVDAAGFYVLGTCAQPGAPCGSTYGPQVTAARVIVRVML